MQDEKLIECVKNREFLYNASHSKYMDSKYKAIAWKEIAEELNQPATQCKSRWQNIRDQYRKYLSKKVIQNGQLVDTQSRKYKYDPMLEFLLPHFQDADAVSKACRLLVSWRENDMEARATNGPSSSSSQDCDMTTEELDPLRSDTNVELPPAPKRRKKNLEDTVEETPAKSPILKYLIQSKQENQKPKSAMQAFLEGLGPSFSKLSQRNQTIAKRRIVDILVKLEENEAEENYL